jgi:putative ABC transport system permease protein
MLKNYLRITSRNLMKNKLFSLVNILGLALGMAACLLIFQYVNFEFSYDRYHPHSESI